MHKQFEDLPVWKAGRELVKQIYARTRKKPFCDDDGLCDQIQRAAVSITSNIAEGHERGSTADLLQFLFYAKGSAGEVRSQLHNAEDVGYLKADDAEGLRQDCLSISRQLSAWMQSMQTPEFRQGPRYHKEPDRRKDQFMAKLGYELAPDGRPRPIRNGRQEDGRQEDGRQEDGRQEDGK